MIDSLNGLADSFIQPPKREQGSMFGQSRAQHIGAKTRLAHKCNRDASCECTDLVTFYLTLAHLTGETHDLQRKLESVQVYEPGKRLPFKAFLTWV